jgi:hypothetical protein
MNYLDAVTYKQALYTKNNKASEALKEFDKYGKSSMGMTPDHVKSMPQWQAAKLAFDVSFAELRNFNGWFAKTFKAEIKKEPRVYGNKAL